MIGIPRRALLGVVLGLVVLTAIVSARLWPKAPLSARAPSSTAIYDRNGQLLRLTLAVDQTYRLWTPLNQMPPELIEAFLLHEDARFYWHMGIDPGGILRGAVRTYSGSMKQGGSTITMQLARMLWRMNTRTPWGKVKQMARAAQLELLYSKREILEAHLNLVPYGLNIEGVGAASLIHFAKPVKALTTHELLALVVIPQAPSKRFAGGGLLATAAVVENHHLAIARQRLLARWIIKHPEAAKYASLAQLPLNLKRRESLPFFAPHAVEALLATQAPSTRSRRRAPFSGIGAAQGLQGAQREWVSSIDLAQQRLVERQVTLYIEQQKRLGITNATALLIDWRTLETRALIGSSDYHQRSIQGQVNGTAARRSPGSTLKPFVYALALDQGVLHPASILKDAPQRFGAFNPENFDGQFIGPVSATEALVKSRNVPAVEVAAKLHGPTLYQFLKEAGVAQLKEEAHYGLALALGGGEVTMEELVTLYAMLANGGMLHPVSLLKRKPDDLATDARTSTRLLSPEAAYLTLDMLRTNPRPDDGSYSPGQRTQRQPVAWKTGTSWGFRDAWSVGVVGNYVLAVWVGNFDGVGNPALVGAQAAAPLFFNIIDALAAQGMIDSVPPRIPLGLAKVEVCSASGDLPNEACPVKHATWFIPGKSPIKVSTLHRRVWVDTRTGREACDVADSAHLKHALVEDWPSDLMRLFAQAGIPRSKAPLPCADADSLKNRPQQASSGVASSAIDTQSPPRITSPSRGATYALQAQATSNVSNTIALAATTSATAPQVFWFIDDVFIGQAASGQALPWTPATAGRFKVRAVSATGGVDIREVTVTF